MFNSTAVLDVHGFTIYIQHLIKSLLNPNLNNMNITLTIFEICYIDGQCALYQRDKTEKQLTIAHVKLFRRQLKNTTNFIF